MKKSPNSTPPTDKRHAGGDQGRFLLRLCITGTTPLSARAIVNVRKICEQHLKGQYELEVIDISEHPELAAQEQVVAAPTLVKTQPPPTRRFIGDMSRAERILSGLGLPPADDKHHE